MDNNDLERLPDGTGLSGSAPSPAVSAVPASIPSADYVRGVEDACAIIERIGLAHREGNRRAKERSSLEKTLYNDNGYPGLLLSTAYRIRIELIASGIEAGTGETLAARPEGQERVPSGDAQA